MIGGGGDKCIVARAKRAPKFSHNINIHKFPMPLRITQLGEGRGDKGEQR